MNIYKEYDNMSESDIPFERINIIEGNYHFAYQTFLSLVEGGFSIILTNVGGSWLLQGTRPVSKKKEQ